MMETPSADATAPLRPVLVALACGAGLLLLAAVYDETTLAGIFPGATLHADRLPGVRVGFAVASVACFCIAAGAALFRSGRARAWVSAIPVALPMVVTVAAAELGLRPFALFRPTTVLFMRDAELGWKLRPNAEDMWGGVRVKINSHGWRGPDREYAKPPATLRVLFLGDSVPFGYGLPEGHTYPERVERILRRALGLRVECINAAVGGYSPWHAYRVLASDGIRYEPNVVVLTFVINDLTEHFGGRADGAPTGGFQLGRMRRSRFDVVKENSALLYFGRRLTERLRFGRDVQTAAQAEENLDIKTLLFHPDRRTVRQAWRVVLNDLDRIVEFCRERRLPLVLVAYPHEYQFMTAAELEEYATRTGDVLDPEVQAHLWRPQQRLALYAQERGVPLFDVAPMLRALLATQALRHQDLFLNVSHLSDDATAAIAEPMARFIAAHLVTEPAPQA